MTLLRCYGRKSKEFLAITLLRCCYYADGIRVYERKSKESLLRYYAAADENPRNISLLRYYAATDENPRIFLAITLFLLR